LYRPTVQTFTKLIYLSDSVWPIRARKYGDGDENRC